MSDTGIGGTNHKYYFFVYPYSAHPTVDTVL